MAKGSGPIQYSDLFAQDVQRQLAELNSLATTLDYSFQELAKSITGMSGRINVQIKSNASTLHEMANNLQAVDVAARGAGDQLQDFAKDTEKASIAARNLKDQEEGLNKVFNIANASVDQISAQIKKLTKEYNSLSPATDNNKAKMQTLATAVTFLTKEQRNLTDAMNTAKKAVQGADGSYNQLSQRLAAAKKELTAMPNAVDKATGALNKNNQAAVSLQREITMLDGSVKKFDASLGIHGRNVGNYTGALKGAIGQLAQFAAGYISIQAAIGVLTSTFDNTVKIDSIRTVLTYTFKSAEIAEEKLKDLQIAANKLGLEFVPLADSYKKFTAAAVAANFPIATAEKLFYATATAGARLKLSTDEVDGSFRAFVQMISKGTVQAEELRGQLGDRLYGAFSITAKAMGVTETALNKMLKSGEVLAADLLPKLAAELDNSFGLKQGEKIEGLQAAVNKLKNVFTGMVAESSNMSRFFEGAINGIAQFSSDITKMINSKSWKEFIFYAFPHKYGTEFDSSDGSSVMKKFSTSSKEGQAYMIKNQQEERDRAFARSSSSHSKDDNEYYVKQAKILMSLKDAWDDLYNAKKPIIELDEKDDKKKEKQLSAIEKLEKRIKDITEAMQNAYLTIPGFAISAQTGALLQDLQEKLRYAQSLGRGTDLPDAKTGGGIDQYQTIVGSRGKIEKQPDFVLSAEEKARRIKAALDEIIPSLRATNQVLGDLFGTEFGNLFDQLTTDIESFAEDGKLSFEELAATATAAGRAISEGFKQGSEQRIEQLQLEKQAQIDIAGTNAVARLNIEKEYNDKIKAEKKKQAQIDKAAAVFEIAINTAVAISKTLAETALFGIPLIPIIAALGALQIAAVLARPIPGFKFGTQNAPEGLAYVAEDDRPELIEGKQGLRIAHKKQLTYLERGDKVFTAEQTRKILDTSLIDSNTELHGRLSRDMSRQVRQDKIKDMAIAFRQDSEAIGAAVGRRIKDLPIHQTYFDERGVSSFIRRGNTTTKLLNNRNSLG